MYRVISYYLKTCNISLGAVASVTLQGYSGLDPKTAAQWLVSVTEEYKNPIIKATPYNISAYYTYLLKLHTETPSNYISAVFI